ncbi:uncharacterized protein LOC135138325 [Zophobas morio]|uniref:uncharacterized protein LOC135138325 n=1 Tax=Zophobas morio TaxID=2755281 RepID=UPI0030839BEA
MEDKTESLQENLQPQRNASSTKKNFRKRSGTTNKGKKYENMIIANIVLHMVSTEKVKNFYVSSNDANFGAFDDVVIEVETDKGIQSIAAQLKHSNKPGNLVIARLASKSGDFSILKYFKSFQEIKKKPQQCILFTNLKLNIFEDTQFQLGGKNVCLEPYKIEIADDSLKLSQHINYCYKFRIVENEGEVDSELQQFKAFLESFSLYSDQQSLETLENSTANDFVKMFCSNQETFEKYLKIISEWDMQEGSKKKLEKKMMQRAVALCLLSPYIENFAFGEVSDKGEILREAIRPFEITLLENVECDVKKWLWGDLDKNIDIKELNKLRSFYRLSPNCIFRMEDVDGNVLAQLLWLMEKRPLIVKEHENIEKAVQLCPDGKFVLVGEGTWKEWMRGRSVFQNLLDLKSEHTVYEKVMQNCTVSLQGKAVLTLMDACGGNEEFLKNISVNNLLEMMDGARPIDGIKEALPNPYIERYLSLNVIDINYLKQLNHNTVVILSCADSSKVIQKFTKIKLTKFDDYLNNAECTTSNAPIFIISENKCSESEFQKICSKTPKTKIVHYFKFLKNTNLEWVRSRGSVGELQNYKLSDHSKNENEFWTFDFSNSISLVLADPGMGKTELTKSLKNKCSAKYWTVIVSPQEANLFFKKSKKSDYLNLFQTFILEKKYHYLEKFDKEFFKMCSEQFRVCYVWDALDEISTEYLKDVSDLIVLLSNKGFTQWVTGRKHLKSLLEKKFNTLSLSINQLNELEQQDYIRKRLNPIISTNNIESAVRKVISSFALIKHIDILGIPLQIFMLTEIVLRNNDKYLQLFGDCWRLTDLYHHFIEEKFNIFYQNKLSLDVQDPYLKRMFNRDKEKILNHYEEVAVGLLFSDCLTTNCQEDIDDYIAIGIITSIQNNAPVFIHTSFAEYLAAAYFAKNFKLIPQDRFFERKFDNVRFFFDMLLAKNSPLHTAVLYRNFDTLEINNEEILGCKDDGGRSVLHLMCSWGKRYPRLTLTSSKKNKKFSNYISTLPKKMSLSKTISSVRYTLDDCDEVSKRELETREYLEGVQHLLKKCSTSEPDGLFKMTPLSFAIVSESLGAELELLQSEKFKPEHLYNQCDRINILFYSTLFGYDKAIKIVCTKQLNGYYDEVNFSFERSGLTALMVASANGHTAIVEHLLQLGSKVNCADQNGQTPLYAACSNGHEEIVECLMKSGAEINRANYHGLTPLYVAAKNDHQKVVVCLLKHGAKINCSDQYDRTPLYLASFNGHEKVVECLAECGAKINDSSVDGQTPLHAAASNGYETIVRCLMKHGAEISSSDNYGWTPIYAASSKGHEKTVECLTKCGAEINRPDDYGETPLYAASSNGSEKMVECLVKCGAEINRVHNYGRTPIYAAAANGHEKTVECLVKCGATINNVDNHGWTALYAAASNGHKKTVECLVKSGAEVNHPDNAGWIPLHVASWNGDKQIVEYLVTHGSEINRADNGGKTPLHLASCNGDVETVHCLVKCGAEINCSSKDGRTPLYMASSEGHDKTVECLVTCGAEINRVDNFGRTPLYAAANNGHEKAVDCLVKHQAEINRTDDNGRTALHLASWQGHERTVQCLVKLGAELNHVDNYAWTPLYAASKIGSKKIVDFLVKSGAEINLTDNDGWTPLHVASRMGHLKTVECLLTSGADINRPSKNDETPLYLASFNVHEKVVKCLVKHGGDINRTNKDGHTLLHVASLKNREKLVECLVKCGAEINRVDNDGLTPLHVASWNGHHKIVECLVKCGAEINRANDDDRTPLHLACLNGHEIIVECLIKYGAEINFISKNGFTPLDIAIFMNHTKIVNFLNEKFAKKTGTYN